MLIFENSSPEKIAYDRPSEKLLKFLRKYYNLKEYIPQNNNYVIYNDYFLNRKITNRNNLCSNDDNYQDYNNQNINNNDVWNENNFVRNKNGIRSFANTNSIINLNSKSKIILSL
jgi:hypothetical protein